MDLIEIGNDDTVAVLQSHPIEPGVQISAVAHGDGHVFLGLAPTVFAPQSLERERAESIESGGFRPGEASLLVISGVAGGEFVASRVALETTPDFHGLDRLFAHDQRCLVPTGWHNRFTVIDARDAAQPVVAEHKHIRSAIYDLDVASGVATAALGGGAACK